LALTPFLLLSVIFADICQLHPSDSHSCRSLLIQYFFHRIVAFTAKSKYKDFLHKSQNVIEEQHELLMSYLEDSKNTEYGRQFRLDEVQNRDDLVRIHPLTDYFHYEKYVDRVCQGEDNVMVNRPLVFVALSSGTTGNFKRIPIFEGHREEFSSQFMITHFLLNAKCDSLRRIVNVRFNAKPRENECGIPMGGISSILAPPNPMSVVPPVAQTIYDEKTQSYVTALLALAEREVQKIDCLLSPICYTFFKTIETRSDELCTDLENGSLSAKIQVTDEVRRIINRCLYPDPERAAEVRREVAAGNDRLALRLWPHLKLVVLCTTGVFEGHARLLKASFLKGVFCMGTGHVASEAAVGICYSNDLNAIEKTQNWVFCLGTCFLEFIAKADIEEATPNTCFLDQVSRMQWGDLINCCTGDPSEIRKSILGIGFQYTTVVSYLRH
jgi:hypothetical protein